MICKIKNDLLHCPTSTNSINRPVTYILYIFCLASICQAVGQACVQDTVLVPNGCALTATSLPIFFSSSLPLFLSSFLPLFLSSSLPLFFSSSLPLFLGVGPSNSASGLLARRRAF
jgi:hypothetical protein